MAYLLLHITKCILDNIGSYHEIITISWNINYVTTTTPLANQYAMPISLIRSQCNGNKNLCNNFLKQHKSAPHFQQTVTKFSIYFIHKHHYLTILSQTRIICNTFAMPNSITFNDCLSKTEALLEASTTLWDYYRIHLVNSVI
jgi:hypothetical protein